MMYDEAIEYIHSIPKFVRPLGNADLERLLAVLGNPHKKGQYIHVAGTNGKGSTAAIIARILMEQGYKTGLYTSPFIEVFNERIRVNGENIPDADLCDITERVKRAAEDNNLAVSEFAFITAAAFLYFAEQKCDFAVMEVGMGGRLDATNVIEKPLVSVITSIGLDHTQYLGETIEEIAAEKCGIIKRGCPVVSQSNAAVREIIKKAAADMDADPVFADDPADGADAGNGHSGAAGFVYKGRYYPLALKGGYQKYNGAAAVEAVNALRKQGVKISAAAVDAGMRNVTWPARFEFTRSNVIIDGAHNIDGILALKKSLVGLKKPYGIVIAMMSDKAAAECVGKIAEGAEFIIASELDMERCEGAEKIAEYADDLTRVITEPDYKRAIDAGLDMLPKNGVLCVCGSLYLAGAARGYLRNMR